MINFETYGNINYGYVGTAMGIPSLVLYAGGGYAAITGKTWDINDFEYFFDSQEDHENIALGIELYNRLH